MLLDQQGSSHISIHSNKNHSHRQPTTNPSDPPDPASPPNHPHHHPHSHAHTLWDQDPEAAYLADLHSKVDSLQRHLEQMESKFTTYIDHMVRDIEKNNESNYKLAKEVETLSYQVYEGGKDLIIIEEYMHKKVQRERTDRPRESGREDVAHPSSKNLLRSGSRPRNILTRRTPGKLFSSKLTLKS